LVLKRGTIQYYLSKVIPKNSGQWQEKIGFLIKILQELPGYFHHANLLALAMMEIEFDKAIEGEI
jgi:hypothetical protein